jgi:hypothetical protein
VSWSIVRTCRRCGTRAEKEIATRQAAARAASILAHHFDHPNSDDGCPSCDPEVAKRLQAAGIDPATYGAAVNRVRNRGPA